MASGADPESTLHIYTRVSTAAQRDEGTSLQTQLQQGEDRAKQLGFQTIHWDEGGKSSHHEELAARPKLAELFQSIQQGLVRHLFVYDQSRLSRNDQVASIFRYECNKQGVTLYTKDGQFDLSNPQDKFLKQILDGLSEFDNAMRAERTRLGKLNRTRTGGWHGGPPPYGYKLIERRLVIETEEAQWVKRIFSEAHDGKSPQKIKALLDSSGVSPRRGGLWSIGSIAALLKNTHYTGRYSFTDKKSDEVVAINCPAIVDPDIWNAVQLKRKRKFSRVLQQNATTRWFYMLRDFMYCGHCGRAIAGRQKPAKREKFYYCANKEREWAKNGGTQTPWKRGTGCGMSRSLNIPETDALVFASVTQMHSNSRVLRQQVKDRVTAASNDEAAKTGKALKDLKSKIRRLEKGIAQLQDIQGSLEGKYDIRALPKKVFESRHRTVKENIEAMEVELNNARLQMKGSESQRMWVDWYRAFGEEMDRKAELTDEQKRDYIAGLVERIEVRYNKVADAHDLTIKFKLPIVGDQLEPKDPKNRRKIRKVLEGVTDLPLRIDKKRQVLLGKRAAP
jgi:DNA invertase Pin-like site-specific DNA recombinase